MNLLPWLRDVLAEAESVLRHQAAEKDGLRFDVEAAPTDLYVRADREKLLQVALNLVTNAVRFTDEDGLVRLRAATAGDTMAIRVHDTGIRIAADTLASIFVSFVRVDESLTRRVGGMWLGLAIAR